MKITIKLDKRRKKVDGTYPLVLYLTFKRKPINFQTGINLLEEQWDGEKIVSHPKSMLLNNILKAKYSAMDQAVTELQFSGIFKNINSVSEFRDIVDNYIENGFTTNDFISTDTFLHTFNRFINTKTKKTTKDTYIHTLTKLNEFANNLQTLKFEDVDKMWLISFESYLEKNGSSVNTRALHFRNIRSVFNFAIDEDITSSYPFRRFKIKTEETRKRSLTVEQLRTYFNAKTTPDQEHHLDVFKLVFMLIGINLVDLYNLKCVEDDGRIYYNRSKTSRPYSIKVEPEAQAIIDKYPSSKHIISVFDTYAHHKTYAQKCNKALKKIGNTVIGKYGRRAFRPLQPDLTLYWARHTWATIAGKLDIPKETIAKALGHGPKTVTDIYIDFDQIKIDEANRKVLDFVLYNKK